jgi:hypothetical protein
MAASFKHAKTSGVTDGADSTLVQPSDWNAEHTITLATGKLLGRTTAGTGAVEEIALGTSGTAVPFLDGANTWSGAQTFYAAGAASIATIDGDAGQFKILRWTTGGLNRWQLRTDSNAESGSNAGSPLTLVAFNDAGTSLGGVFSIARATQVMTFTQIPAVGTAAAGDNTTSAASTAYAMAAAPNSSYRTILDCTGSHTAAKVAGTYAMGQGDPLAVSGTGTLYPINIISIKAADYPTVNGLAPKLRIRGQIAVNDVAPTGNFTFGLYPVTRPATSGGAALCIYTLGTVVTGSNGATVSAPAADSHSDLVGSDFALPADGLYCIGVVTTATVATSSHLHLSATLQLRNA